MINPSELDISVLPWLPLDARSAFPRQPAIYFAIDSQNKIQYIGKTIDPKPRWRSHHKFEALQETGFIKIAYLFVDSPELLSGIESALIQWFNPPLNVIGKATSEQESDSIVIEKPLRPGFVYLLHLVEDYYKLGKSINPSNRSKFYSRDCLKYLGSTPKLIHSIKVFDVYQSGKYFSKKLDRFRAKNFDDRVSSSFYTADVFRLSEAEVSEFCGISEFNLEGLKEAK